MGPRPPAAPLIEQNNPVHRRIKIPPHRRAAPTTRPAMHDQNRHPIGVATLFKINPVPAPNLQHLLIKRVKGRV
jgi:hypothetical protein